MFHCSKVRTEETAILSFWNKLSQVLYFSFRQSIYLPFLTPPQWASAKGPERHKQPGPARPTLRMPAGRAGGGAGSRILRQSYAGSTGLLLVQEKYSFATSISWKCICLLGESSHLVFTRCAGPPLAGKAGEESNPSVWQGHPQRGRDRRRVPSSRILGTVVS